MQPKVSGKLNAKCQHDFGLTLLILVNADSVGVVFQLANQRVESCLSLILMSKCPNRAILHTHSLNCNKLKKVGGRIFSPTETDLDDFLSTL